MNSPLGRASFFALEAGEYLERLGAVLNASRPPAAEEFVRLTRALRGAAIMAGPASLAKAAAALERIAKAYRDGSLTWTREVDAAATTAVTQLQELVPLAQVWGDLEATRSEEIARHLEGFLPPDRPAPASGPASSGLRAFIAREATQLAGILDELAAADAASPPYLRAILHRTESLRGLAPAGQPDGLPAFLEGLAGVSAELLRGYPPPAGIARLFAAARETLRLILAPDTSPSPGGAEEETFGGLLYDWFAREGDVVPIGDLGSPTPVERGGWEPPSRPADPVDLVSLGDRFRQAAAHLEPGRSDDERGIHLYTLAATLRGLPTVAGAPPVRDFAERLQSAIREGSALGDSTAVAAALRAAATPLGEADGLTMDDIAADLSLAAGLLPSPTRSARPMESTPVAPAAVTVTAPPIASAADDGDVVPIESLLFSDRTALERSLSSLHRLARARPEAVSAASPPPPAGVPLLIVPIDELLFRGEAARREAEIVRGRIAALTTSSSFDVSQIKDLVDELLDLVPLALGDTR